MQSENDLNYYADNKFNANVSYEYIEQEIKEYNKYEGELIGIGGVHSEQYQRFKMLYNKATDEELLRLTNDTNAVMRCYAFLSLSKRNVMYMESILRDHLNDTVLIENISGCIGVPEEVNLIFLSIASPYLSETALDKYRSVAEYKKRDLFSVMH